MGADARRQRDRERRKAKLRVVTTDDDDFVESVQRDLDALPTIEEPGRRPDRSKRLSPVARYAGAAHGDPGGENAACSGGCAGRSRCSASPGSRTAAAGAGSLPGARPFVGIRTLAPVEPRGRLAAVERRLDRGRVDAGAGVADAHRRGSPARTVRVVRRARRRGAVVDPEAETEGAGAAPWRGCRRRRGTGPLAVAPRPRPATGRRTRRRTGCG